MALNPSEDSQFEELARKLAPSRRKKSNRAVRSALERSPFDPDPYLFEGPEHTVEEFEDDEIFLRDFVGSLAVDYGLAWEFAAKDLGAGQVSLVDSRGATGTFTRATTATTVDRSGKIVSVASGVARSYYDPTTLEYLGYLAEGARTNYALSSTNFAAWTDQNTPVVTSNSAIAPDGTLSADTITDDDATLYEAKFATGLPVNVGGSVCFSVYVKKDAVGQATRYSLFRLELTGSVGPQILEMNIDTSTGERTAFAVNAGGSYVTNSAVEDKGDYWRVWISGGTTDAGWTSTNLYIFPAVGAGALATDTSMYSAAATGFITVWGAQVEIGAFPSSYIPTTTAAVTRNADVLTWPTSGWLNSARGTMVVNGQTFAAGQTGYLPVPFALAAAGSTNDETIFYVAATSLARFRQVAAGVQQVDFGTRTWSANTSTNLAAAYDGVGAYGFSVAGATTEGSAVGTVPTMSTAYIGGRSNAAVTNNWYGTIARAAYYSTRVANTPLQSL